MVAAVSKFGLGPCSRVKAWSSSFMKALLRTIGIPETDGVSPSATCPRCGTTISAQEVRELGKSQGFGVQLLAALDKEGRHLLYRLPTEDDLVALDQVGPLLEALDHTPDGLTPAPDEDIDPTKYRRLQSLVFGISAFRDLFTPRQLLAAAVLCDETRRAHEKMLAAGMTAERARAVATYVALLIDRIVDYNSSFCTWHRTREMTGHTYARQSIAMVWDFVEIDPFSTLPGNWWAGIKALEVQ